jgi:hypothetical protein
VESLAQCRVSGANFRGNEHFHRLPDEFFARVAEEFLALRVGQLDAAIRAHHH